MKTAQIKLKNRFKSYPEYRDSGIEWIGKVPKEWEGKKISSVFEFPKDKVSDEDYEPLSVTYGGIKKQVETAAKSDDGTNRKKVLKGDIAINGRSDRKGAVGVSDYDGSISLVYHVLRKRDRETETRFFHYLFRSKLFSEEFYRWGRGIVDDLWTTRSDEMKRIGIPIPSVETQKKIAEYLDEKTVLIDQIIEKKKQLIKLLNEAAYSSSVVGMRGDVSDRNSLWQGEDTSWSSKKAKWIFEEINIRNRPEEEMLAVTQDGGVVPKRLRQEQFVSSSSSEGLKLVEENDFVISLRSFQGGIEYSKYKGLVSPAYTVIRLRKEYDTDFYRNYYKYLLKSSQFIGILNTVISGIRDGKNINFSDFKDIILPIPPMNSLNSMMTLTKKVELLAAYLKKQEKLFLEYKSSLISNVVTGKIRV